MLLLKRASSLGLKDDLVLAGDCNSDGHMNGSSGSCNSTGYMNGGPGEVTLQEF